MKHWNLSTPGVVGAPEILSSSDEGRAVLLHLAAGGALADHQVHERAWVSLVRGEVRVTATASGETATLAAPALVEFAPAERHELQAITDASVVLVLAPWPGDGHPGATPLEIKGDAHLRAREHRQRSHDTP